MDSVRFVKTFVSMAAVAAAGTLAGCSMWSGGDGVPLEELDLTGDAPTSVALLGPDKVVITAGTPFRITAEGPAAEGLRFSLKHGALGISREAGFWDDKPGEPATVRITMPAPESLTIAGSGHMTSTALAKDATVSVAGSGTVETPLIDVDSLEVSVAGSGDYVAGGTADRMDISIAGSGNARLDALMAAKANVNLAGSGNVSFASNGAVEGNIMGSGNVTVIGSALCQVRTLGSGTLRCKATAAAQ